MTDTDSRPVPKVIFWFKSYAAFLAALYALMAVFGIVIMVAPGFSDMKASEGLLVGLVCLGLSVPFMAAFVLPFFLPLKKGVWIYNLVLISIGMTSCCTIPFSVALLVYWIKPEVREYFNS